jgi:hypothetical protein
MPLSCPSLYASVSDYVYSELRAAAEQTGAALSDEADEALLTLAHTLANDPESDITVPTVIETTRPALTLPDALADGLLALAANNGVDPQALLEDAVRAALRTPKAP